MGRTRGVKSKADTNGERGRSPTHQPHQATSIQPITQPQAYVPALSYHCSLISSQLGLRYRLTAADWFAAVPLLATGSTTCELESAPSMANLRTIPQVGGFCITPQKGALGFFRSRDDRMLSQLLHDSCQAGTACGAQLACQIGPF